MLGLTDSLSLIYTLNHAQSYRQELKKRNEIKTKTRFAEQNSPEATTGRNRNTTTKLTVSLQAFTPPHILCFYTCLNFTCKSADAIKPVNVSGAPVE